MSLIEMLDEAGFDYDVFTHPAVFTVEEAKLHTSHLPGVHCKNLFLRNRNGRTHYLFVFQEDRQVDLKQLSDQLGINSLSFASKERLFRHLNLTPGSVSPFGLINDVERQVKVFFDVQVADSEYSSFHPNINTQTIVIKTKDLLNFIESMGYIIQYI